MTKTIALLAALQPIKNYNKKRATLEAVAIKVGAAVETVSATKVIIIIITGENKAEEAVNADAIK